MKQVQYLNNQCNLEGYALLGLTVIISHATKKSVLDTVWVDTTLRDVTTCRLFLWVIQIMVEGFPLEMTMTISVGNQAEPTTILLVSLISTTESACDDNTNRETIGCC